MQASPELEQTSALARSHADRVGIRLKLEQIRGHLVIVAYEIQTGVRLKDLPRMGEQGYWASWSDSLQGLKELD
jgi:hypothetical protein